MEKFEANKVQTAEVGNDIQVLIVDDNYITRRLICILLKNWNIKHTEASSALEAYDLISNKSFSLILMDIQMPEIDGFEATRFIRNLNDSYFKKLPVIGLSAHREEDVKLALNMAGISDYLAKPFAPEDLKYKLAQYITGAFDKNPVT